MKMINDDEIKKITKQRDLLEVQLANALLSRIEGDALWEVKNLCRDLLRKILSMMSQKIAEATVENNWLRMWKRYPPIPSKADLADRKVVVGHLERLLTNSFSWSAEDCSDVIRLYGEIVEKDPQFEVEALRKDTFRGATLIKDKHGKVRGEIVHDVSFATGGVTHSGQKFGFRARERGQGGAPPGYVSNRYGRGATGITKSALAEYDTVKKIDHMFALPEGASISGTTADSIYCTDIATSKKLTGWLQLLPIATMVSQYHHTVLECALTLTLNKKVQYQIGFYRSLAPLTGSISREVEVVLGTYEDRAINNGLLVYAWTNKGVRRGLALGAGDGKALEGFRDLARVTDEHMRVWRVMAPNNTVGPAWELWEKHMKGLTLEQAKVVADSQLKQEALARYGVRGDMLRPKVDVTKKVA